MWRIMEKNVENNDAAGAGDRNKGFSQLKQHQLLYK